MEKLKELVDKLERAFHDRLVSVVLYGSAATDAHDEKFSDLNILCVLKEITPRELSEGEPVLRWWRDQGNPAPLLLSEDEVFESADSFPIEFRDMKDHRRVLFGVDVIADLHVDTRNHRTQVEHDLRAKLLRLRQRGAEVLSDPVALLKLCLESVTTFIVLGRHALLAAGIEPKSGRHAIVRQLALRIEADMASFETLLSLRGDRAGVEPGDPGELFAQYLVAVQALVRFVDRLDGHSQGHS